MGFGFRKSIKIGKNTRINLSKTGGIGFSTGVKGARASINAKGVRTQVGSNGMYYRTQKGFGDKTKTNNKNNAEVEVNNNGLYSLPINLKAKASKKQWTLTLIAILCLFLTSMNIGFGFLAIIFGIWSLFCKESRYNLKYSRTIFNFVNGNFVKAEKLANKSKKIMNTEQVDELLDLIKEKNIY